MSRGFTTEDDTGLEDDPVAAAPKENEGGAGFLSKVKLKKMMIRAAMGITMMVTFAAVIYLGHAYICLLVFALQCFIFSELVGVRKKQAAERRLPLFRSIQWAWFLVSAFFTWSAHVSEFLLNNPKQFETWTEIGRLIIEKNMALSFALYATMLIVSVLSLRKGLYRYQLTQYTWTCITIGIVVFQTQVVFQIIYAGLFWFVLPSSLVICNDIMAYYCGVVFGKKIIKRRFLELSPNKTWEGFLGSAIFTMIFAVWFSERLSHFKSMTCAPDNITFYVTTLECEPASMYKPKPLSSHAASSPSYVREALFLLSTLAPRLSTWVGKVEAYPVQIHALCLGLFASFVAPFGGFLSSAIKRAYGIKDFNNLIPGHGGMMDRFDCQFVMFLCTYVHHRTFIKATVTVEGLLYLAAQLTTDEQRELLRRMSAQLLPPNGAL